MTPNAMEWPAAPELEEPRPPRARRAWGKVSHSERYRRQRRSLLRAAARLAEERGYERTRVADIVSEAGLSKSTFYEHFSSKEECFVELHRRTSAQMLQAAVETAEATIERGPYECVLAVVRSLVGYADRNPRLAAALRADFGASEPQVRRQREENLRRIIHFFAALGRRLGSPLDDRDLELTASVLVHGVTDILGTLRSEPGRFDEALARVARLGCRSLELAR